MRISMRAPASPQEWDELTRYVFGKALQQGLWLPGEAATPEVRVSLLKAYVLMTRSEGRRLLDRFCRRSPGGRLGH
jgi:hypothetical protein